MIKKLLGAMLLCICNIAYAEEFDAKVIVVMDGDTVMVLRDGKKVKVRLANIDAPESDQDFGKESRQSLAESVLKQQVHINTKAVDDYGRMIAEISLDGKNINEEQVSKGMAWEYSHFHGNRRFLELSEKAKQAQLGLWSSVVQPISPERWRKSHPKQNKHRMVIPIEANVVCGRKHLCSQMKSCDEAKIYFMQCGIKSLDGNGDGVPCESLCVNDVVVNR